MRAKQLRLKKPALWPAASPASSNVHSWIKAATVRTVIALAVLAYFVGGALADGGDVPLDSSRGAYEGAENIHWYMQDTLDYTLLAEDPPRLPELESCNGDDLFLSCSGEVLSGVYGPVQMFAANHDAQVLAYVRVDSRIDFAWRYALRQIREVNRMFDRSGIALRILVAEIETVGISASEDDGFRDILESLESNRDSLTVDNEADIIIQFLHPESFFSGSSSQPFGGERYIANGVNIYAAVANSDGTPYSIQVVVTPSQDPRILAHGIGHTIGLAHEDDGDSLYDFPITSKGVGYIDEQSQCGTIMNPLYCWVPFFSSPRLIIDVPGSGRVRLGSEMVDAVSVANDARFILSQSNEVTHQGLVVKEE